MRVQQLALFSVHTCGTPTIQPNRGHGHFIIPRTTVLGFLSHTGAHAAGPTLWKSCQLCVVVPRRCRTPKHGPSCCAWRRPKHWRRDRGPRSSYESSSSAPRAYVWSGRQRQTSTLATSAKTTIPSPSRRSRPPVDKAAFLYLYFVVAMNYEPGPSIRRG